MASRRTFQGEAPPYFSAYTQDSPVLTLSSSSSLVAIPWESHDDTWTQDFEGWLDTSDNKGLRLPPGFYEWSSYIGYESNADGYRGCSFSYYDTRYDSADTSPDPVIGAPNWHSPSGVPYARRATEYDIEFTGGGSAGEYFYAGGVIFVPRPRDNGALYRFALYAQQDSGIDLDVVAAALFVRQISRS